MGRVLIFTLLFSFLGPESFAAEPFSLAPTCGREMSEVTTVNLLENVSLRESFRLLREKVSEKIIGQSEMIEALLVSLLVDQHLIIIGPSGTSKTRGVSTFAEKLEGEASYLSVTSDMMPSDLIGSYQTNPETGKNEFTPGPLFGNFVHLDELNRGGDKLQSGTLEIMERRKVKINGKFVHMGDVYFVVTTINPESDRGTHSFVQAQGDRFLLSLRVTHAELGNEKLITELLYQESLKAAERAVKGEVENLSAPIISLQMIRQARLEILKINLPENLKDYLNRIIVGTRPNSVHFASVLENDLVGDGVSVRATNGLERAVRARAWLDGRTVVIRDDVDALAPLVLRHRLELSPNAKAAGFTVDTAIEALLKHAKANTPE